LKLKCTKIDFGWGFAPDRLTGFKGPTSKAGEWKGEREWEGRKGKGKEEPGGFHFYDEVYAYVKITGDELKTETKL